jgi:hypothetical protein
MKGTLLPCIVWFITASRCYSAADVTEQEETMNIFRHKVWQAFFEHLDHRWAKAASWLDPNLKPFRGSPWHVMIALKYIQAIFFLHFWKWLILVSTLNFILYENKFNYLSVGSTTHKLEVHYITSSTFTRCDISMFEHHVTYDT